MSTVIPLNQDNWSLRWTMRQTQMPIRDITSKWTASRLATVSDNIISHSAVLKQKLLVKEHPEFVCSAGARTMVKASESKRFE